jgi:CheY-like chemotaxis protein
MNAPNTNKSLPTLHVLVVEDDPMFRRQMEAAAAERGIAVTTCGSLREVQAMAMPDVFDLAIVDYYLDGVHRAMTGPTIARRLRDTPTLFISHDPNCIAEGESWPASVRHFMSKEAGVKRILDTALRIKGLVS